MQNEVVIVSDATTSLLGHESWLSSRNLVIDLVLPSVNVPQHNKTAINVVQSSPSAKRPDFNTMTQNPNSMINFGSMPGLIRIFLFLSISKF